MDIWQTLEIEPTPDQKAIKRAYSKKLKVTRPDENAEAFQSLHYAYKAALHQATYWDEYQQEYKDDTDESKQPEHQDESESQRTAEISIITEQPIIDSPVEPTLETADLNPPDNSVDETTTETQVNPLQLEGERLLGLTELFLATSNGGQNNPKNWTFIIESPFILEDHFNWRLGLELLRVIHEHNLNHVAKVSSLVGQEALTYLNSIFNWMDNRYHVTRALGDDYNTWLDMIRDNNESEKNYRDKIRGGKNLLLQQKNTEQATQPTARRSSLAFSRFCAFFLDCIFLLMLIGLLANGENTDGKTISTQALAILSMFAVFIYFGGFEASILQGTPGKKIMKLAVITDQGNPLEVLHASFRTLCFFAFYIFFFTVPAGISALLRSFDIDFYVLSIAIQAYGIYLAARPINFYDKISKTRVIQI
jgi:uncharacterized RDD family membrane protein YckC